MASAHQPPPVHQVLGPAVAQAMQAATAIGQLEQLSANTSHAQASAKLAEAEAHRSNVHAGLQTAQTATEGERRQLTEEMARTELARQRELAARATLSSAQTVTESERPTQVRAETGRAIEQGNLARIQEHNQRTYGPPGPVSSTVGSISQIWNSIMESLR